MDRRLNRTPIREQIYNIIRKNIIELKYQPGERLSIMSISKELNVSNSPVRGGDFHAGTGRAGRNLS